MPNRLAKNLREIFGKNLNDYHLVTAYFMELNAPTWIRLPAIHAQSREIVIADSMEIINQIKGSLPRDSQNTRVIEIMGLVDDTNGVFYSLDAPADTRLDLRPQPYITAANVGSYFARNKKPFVWAS